LFYEKIKNFKNLKPKIENHKNHLLGHVPAVAAVLGGEAEC
jgi:hypothetical protein